MHTIFVINFKEALKIKAFRKLCMATFLVFNAFNTVAAFSYFIILHYLFDGSGAGLWPTLFGCVGALITTFLVIPFVTQISKKIGKKKAFLVSQSISISRIYHALVLVYTRETLFILISIAILFVWYWRTVHLNDVDDG